MITEQLNPCFFWISESIKSERAIAQSRGDLDSFAKTLTVDYLVDKIQLKRDYKWLVNKIEENDFSPRYPVAVSIVLFLNHKKGLPLKKSFTKKAKDLLLKAVSLNLTNQKYIDVYTYISRSKYKIAGLKERLEKLRHDSESTLNLNTLIEVDFALREKGVKSDLWDKKVDILSKSLNLARISKLGILLNDTLNDNERVNQIVTLVEQRCNETLENMSLPTISLAIYEAEKIINTNLPQEKLRSILEALKVQDKKWSEIISEVSENGVTVDLNKVNNLLNFSIDESIWVLELLSSVSRIRTVQIGKSEYDELSVYQNLKSKGKFVSSRLDLIKFLVSNTLFVLLGIWYLKQKLSSVNFSLSLEYFSLYVIPLIAIIVLLQSDISFWKNGKFDLMKLLSSISDRISSK